MRCARRCGKACCPAAAVLSELPGLLAARLNGAADPDERAAYRILHDALAEPARVIYENAGYEPGDIMGRMMQAGAGKGFDAIGGRLIDSGCLLDGAAVQKMALKNAVLTAGMALTIDVLVHHRTPEIARSPG